jgi:DNA-binding NarL/FixJ family response regulator
MRALLIDDHELIRDAVGRLLREELGCNEVLEAADLDEALDLLGGGADVHFIITDLNMPGVSMFVPRAIARRGPEPALRVKRHLQGLEHLPPRQGEVLEELLLGRSSKEIARALNVAEGP